MLVLFVKYAFNFVFFSGDLCINLFQTWCDPERNYTIQFDSSLDDIDVHSRSQGHRKART